MDRREEIIHLIVEAFAGNSYPGDQFLQGSSEGEEPAEAAEAFRGKEDWQALDSGFLDGDPAALSFLSEAAFRFYLPAYLIADLREELDHVNVLFHLTHGFHDASAELTMAGEKFSRHFGRTALVNPRRYGAMSWRDYARFRHSIFTREEASAIVAFLEYRLVTTGSGPDREGVEAALNSFWRERAAVAPKAVDLKRHLAEEERFMAAVSREQHGRIWEEG